MKDIKDYLPFYLGCEVMKVGKRKSYKELLTAYSLKYYYNHFGHYDTKLILRPLSDMSDKEKDFRWNNFINIKVIDQTVVAEEIRWLLSKGFDLFGLIESGLAISKTQTQEQ